MNPKALGSLMMGGIFIVCGLAWLASTLLRVDINFGLLWPLFLLAPGIFFWAMYLIQGRKEFGLVIPGTILLSLGVVFYLNIVVVELFGYGQIWALTAFMYPGSVALALWVGWIASGREFGLAVGAFVLTVISFLIFCFTTTGVFIGEQVLGYDAQGLFWPFLFICAGIFILVSPFISSALGRSGDDLGKKMENWGDEFGKQMERMGEDIEKSVDRAFASGSEQKKDSQQKPKDSDVDEAEIV